mmetsp:Transcript_69700/g.188427  ORF Transcript_69700/g.188427 Transcript_69700/m.188427 type:complete len:210 (+) Transcript_69700:531-1160(+)
MLCRLLATSILHSYVSSSTSLSWDSVPSSPPMRSAPSLDRCLISMFRAWWAACETTTLAPAASPMRNSNAWPSKRFPNSSLMKNLAPTCPVEASLMIEPASSNEKDLHRGWGTSCPDTCREKCVRVWSPAWFDPAMFRVWGRIRTVCPLNQVPRKVTFLTYTPHSVLPSAATPAVSSMAAGSCSSSGTRNSRYSEGFRMSKRSFLRLFT